LRVFLSIVAVLVLVGGLIAGFFGEYWVMAVAFAGFVGCLLAANLDRISEFKASKSGVEAKTREVVARAENTLRELQLLAMRIAELSLSLVQRTGRWGGYSDEEQDRIKNDLISVLREIKISEADIQGVLIEWHRVVEFDYAQLILGGSTVPDKNDPKTMAAWKSLGDGGISNVPTPEMLERFLDEFGFMSPERREQLADYAYYRIHRVHRRPEAWAARQSWGRLEGA
jgi:hypothetical protein